MKILFILEYYYPNIGGVEKLFKDLTENLAAQGHEILVITTQFDKKLPTSETIHGVHVKRLKLTNRFLFTFFSVFKILPLAKKYDFIHTTSYNAAFPAWMVAKLFRKKSIITFHEVWGDLWNELPYLSFFQKKLYSVYESFILKLNFDFYIAVSDFTKSKLIESGIPENKIRRIYNGININDYQTKSEASNGPFTFTYFGRLGVSKGLNIILPAAKQFIVNHPESIFKCIIPKIPQALFLEIISEIKRLEFGNKICLYHSLSFDDLKTEIKTSSCILIPSYSEGFCYAAVESKALKTPIISSGRGSLCETVTGKHIIMDSLDVNGLKNALEKAYMNNWSFVPEKEFLLKESIEHYLNFYQGLLEKT